MTETGGGIRLSTLAEPSPKARPRSAAESIPTRRLKVAHRVLKVDQAVSSFVASTNGSSKDPLRGPIVGSAAAEGHGRYDRVMPEEARAAITVLRRAHEDLIGFSEDLSDEQLRARSGSSEWNVAAVLSHLGSAAEIGLNTVTAGQADMDAAKAIWARWNSMTPNEQAKEFAAASRRLSDALEALTDAQLADHRIDMGFLPAPVNVHFYTSMRLGEVGLHGWDVHVPFDGAATVRADIVPYVLDQLPMFAGFFGKPADRTEELSVKTTTPDREYRLSLRQDGVNLEQEASGSPNQLTLPGESFLRLTSGRLDPDHTPAAVTIEGAITLDDLRRAFPGY
jgi:uncharacterized protein (TIGR03083 family)